MSEMQKSYIDFLVTPAALRDPNGPQSETEWATQRSLRPAKVFAWKKDPDFQREWQKRLARARVTPDRINEVYEAMHAAALGGNVQAAKLYLESNNRLNPPPELLDENTATAVSELSDEELAALLAEAAEAELKRRK